MGKWARPPTPQYPGASIWGYFEAFFVILGIFRHFATFFGVFGHFGGILGPTWAAPAYIPASAEYTDKPSVRISAV